MTQQEFSRRIGISQNYLSTMERGKVEIGAEILLCIWQEYRVAAHRRRQSDNKEEAQVGELLPQLRIDREDIA
jgi:transcriptional regulator with XRE-family HTH domain